MKAKKVLEIAKKEIGYTEEPPHSNQTKYGKWFGFDGVPWCAIFVSWVYDQAGAPLGNIGFRKGMAGCQTAVAHFSGTKQTAKGEPAPGDIVFFDWNDDGRYDHTGIYVRKLTATTFETIEGNTSPTNQSNGGIVMLRTRFLSDGALFIHPNVLNL